MKSHGIEAFLACIAVAALCGRASATEVVLQPSNSGSADAFVYQFLPTYNFSAGPFGDLLSAGNTMDGTNNGHNTDALIQFNLSSSATGLAQGTPIASATLQLYAISTATEGFGADPSAANPITLSVKTLSGTWNAATVTYGSVPSVTSNTYPSANQAGINQWVNFNVTSEVQQWLNGAISNDGLLITQASAVDVNGQPAIGVYYSTVGAQANSTAALGPMLVITIASTAGQSVWSAGVSGSWSDSSKWSGGVPNAPGAAVAFNGPTGNQVTVVLNSPETIGTLQFNNSASGSVGYTLSGVGSNVLMLNNAGSTATINVAGGSHNIDAPVILTDGLQASISSGTLAFGTASTISGTGTLSVSGTGGTLILGGTDTYGGGTSVSAGTLVLDGALSLPSGSSLLIGSGSSANLGSIFSGAAAGDPAAVDPAANNASVAAPATAPVPEPGTLAMFAVASFAVLAIWARRAQHSCKVLYFLARRQEPAFSSHGLCLAIRLPQCRAVHIERG